MSALDRVRASASSISLPIRLFCPGAPLTETQRLAHPYLFYLTDVLSADTILGKRCLDATLSFVGLGQDLAEAALWNTGNGVAMIFTWAGTHRVGDDMPPPPLNVTYHHVGPRGHRGSFIAKGSTASLQLVALAWMRTDGQYSESHLLVEPIDIAIAP